MIRDIVYFHERRRLARRAPDYFPFVLELNRRTNPGARHHLIGDYAHSALDTVVHPSALDTDEVRALRAAYVHLSPNPESFELPCLLRWFHLARYAREAGLTRFAYLDSDNVLFRDLATLPADLGKSLVFEGPLGGVPFVCPNVFLILEPSLLDEFVRTTLDAYTNEVDELRALAAHLQVVAGCGISDMVFWGRVFERSQGRIASTRTLERELYCVAMHDGQGYETERFAGEVLKRVYWNDGRYVAKRLSDGAMVPIASLHFHAQCKRHVERHYWRYRRDHERTAYTHIRLGLCTLRDWLRARSR